MFIIILWYSERKRCITSWNNDDIVRTRQADDALVDAVESLNSVYMMDSSYEFELYFMRTMGMKEKKLIHEKVVNAIKRYFTVSFQSNHRVLSGMLSAKQRIIVFSVYFMFFSLDI